MGNAAKKQEAKEQAAKLQDFCEHWDETLELLKAVGADESEALDFGKKLSVALDALDAGLEILSELELIDKLCIELSGWTDEGRNASVNYSTSREMDEEGEYQEVIRKETLFQESI